MSINKLQKNTALGAIEIRTNVDKFNAVRHLKKLAGAFIKFDSNGDLVADDTPLVSVTPQALTVAQKAQVWANIGSDNTAARLSRRAVLPGAGANLGTRFAWANGLSVGATGTKANFDISHVMTKAGTASTWTYANSYNGDLAGPSVVTVRVALENYTANPGVFIPLYFNGSRDLVLQPGAIGTSSVSGLTWRTGDVIVERVFVTVPTNSDQWPTSVQSGKYAREGGQQSDAQTDLTTSGTRPVGSSAYRFGAVQMSALPIGGLDVAEVAVIGDSIAFGQGDAPPLGAPSSGVGFIQRAFNNLVPYRFQALSGSTADGYIAGLQQRIGLIPGCTSMLCQFGTNDLAGGASLATLQTSWLALWTAASNAGIRVYQTTIFPRSTAANFYLTEVAQTPAATNAIRVTCNAWLRDGSPINSSTKLAVATGTVGALRAGETGHPLTGVMDIALLVEGATSGTWKQDAGSRTLTDVNFSGTTVTSATANFTTADLGRVVYIPATGGAATIYQLDSATQVRINAGLGTLSNQTALFAFQLAGDGVHPSTQGHIVLATGVNISALTTLP